MTKITVTICTHNRSELLTECLQSLCKQTIPRFLYEILVIDNNSTDDTKAVVLKFSKKYNNIRLVEESKIGLSHARNTGFKNALTDWVAYIDDDAKAHPNYIERALFTIEKYSFDCFGGIYLPWYRYGKPKWFRADYYGSNKNGKPKEVCILERGHNSGGVIVFKKKVLEGLGGFATNLGMNGQKMAYGEESHLQEVMRMNGLQVGFDPELKIDHLVASRKLTLKWQLKSAYKRGYSYSMVYYHKSDLRNQDIIRDFLILIAGTFKRIITKSYKYFSEKDFYIQNWILEVIQPSANLWGIIKYKLDNKRA